MSYIYSCCRSCPIWLGPPTEDSEAALDLMDSVSAACKASRYNGNDDSPSLLTTLRKIRIEDKQRRASTAFFSHEYWKRLWVVQEILLSPHKLVFCEERNFGWEWLGCFTHLYLMSSSSEDLIDQIFASSVFFFFLFTSGTQACRL